MSETEPNTVDQTLTDPPESQGGTEAAALSVDGATQPKPLDPPDGNGGTGGG